MTLKEIDLLPYFSTKAGHVLLKAHLIRMTIYKFKIILLSIGLLLVPFIGAIGQTEQAWYQEDSWFTRFGYEEGYPEGIVLDILQDQQGFLWIATADGLFKFDGYTFTEFRVKTKTKSGLQSNVIRSIAEVDQQLYITSNEGTAWTELDLRTEQMRNRSHKESGIPTNQIRQFYKDKEERLWMASDKGLLMKPPGRDTLLQYLPEDTTFPNTVERIFGTEDGRLWLQMATGFYSFDPLRTSFQSLDWYFLEKNPVRAFFEDRDGRLWIGTDEGLYLVDWLNDSIERVGAKGALALSSQAIRAIQSGTDGKLYVGTMDGLNALDFKKEENTIFQSEAQSSQYISEDRVSCLFTDQQGLLWIGTWGRELQYLNFQRPPFQYLQVPIPEANNINAIQSIDNSLWLGTENKGLVRINLSTKDVKYWSNGSGLGSRQVYALSLWKNKLWVGLGLDGYLNCIDPQKEELSLFSPQNAGLPDEEIWAMTTDKEDHLWVAGEKSLFEVKNLNSDGSLELGRQFTTFSNEEGEPVEIGPRSLEVDQDNQLWIGTAKNGLLKLDLSSERFTHFPSDPNDLSSCPGAYVNTIYEDSKGQIWVGTSTGVGRLDVSNKQFFTLTEEDGLPNNFVFTIFEDRTGHLWFSTNRGLVKYAPENQGVQIFMDKEGLPINEFNQNAGLFKDGKIYYGTINGMVILHPERLVNNTFIPPVVFTNLTYRNRKSNAPAVENSTVTYLEKIRLNYLENILEIEFAALNFHQSAKNQYRYQLKGFSDNWVDLGEKRRTTFSGLKPGLYTLRVQGSNNNGLWNEEGASLQIRITPPFWKTTIAYFLYVLALILFMIYLYRFMLTRKLVQAEEKRQKELAQAKTRFFTNIAHEFKNPLTIIMSMAQELKDNEKVRSTIIRHGSDIRRLINQVLDLRRLENNQMPVEIQQIDMVAFSGQLISSFEPLAQQRSIQLLFSASPEKIMMDTDREKWMAILSNLVSNAIKYNQKGGRVEVNLLQQQDYLEVEVRDTGRGIPAESIPHVFERFYQVDTVARTVGGTGVGLALVKEFVTLLNGQISLESQMGQGTCFRVRLPIQQEGPLYANREEDDFDTSTHALITEENFIGSSQNKLLIVEDNLEILNYLKEKLAKFFSVISATNGEEGINTAIEEVPDLIISDVMMPKKDGIELLETLKNNDTTSHIPIILLSAKSAVDDRIRGLEKGADRYLGKPFLQDELWAHIYSLLNNRTKMQSYYRKQLLEPESRPKLIDPFLDRAQQAVLDHLSEEDFNVSHLCNTLNISRTQLHQKLKATVDKSASHFMNEIRLREGRKLLLNSTLNISEIAYSVGFKDPSYFSACFKDLYGKTPSEFRK